MKRLKNRMLSFIIVSLMVSALAFVSGTALAFNPQPEPPAMSATFADQFDYIFPGFDDLGLSPGTPPDAIGSAAQFNPIGGSGR